MNKRVSILLVVLLLVSSCLSGCFSEEYKGEYSELYTVAVYNFLGRNGSWSNGELVKGSEIEMLETDSYGRVMFYYHEGINEWGCGYGILQKTQDGYAYFYEDDCILVSGDDWSGKVLHEKWFTEEELDAFKARNDWEQPLNEEKCTKKAVVTKEPEGKTKLTEDEWDALVVDYWNEIAPGVYENVYSSPGFLTEDAYGRELYWMHSSHEDDTGETTYYDFAIIINPNGTCDGISAMLLLNDYTWDTWEETAEFDYCEDLKVFKQQNGWNTEYTAN